MKFKNIHFFNNFHNGDIHVSRTFVSEICKKIGLPSYSYSHRNNQFLLEDCKFIRHSSGLCDHVNHYRAIIEKNSELFINTWYGCENYMSLSGGINFDCLYLLFNNACNHLGFTLNDISNDPFHFFPNINYKELNQIYINNIDNYCSDKKYEDLILACNNQVLSGQATNFNFTKIFLELSKIYSNKIWILTNRDMAFDPNQYPNVVYTSDIIRKNINFDLNEISYLSTKCSTIIGRASGPFSFAICKENWVNPNKKIISFSNLSNDSFWMGNWGLQNIKPKATVVESKETRDSEIIKIISNLL